MPRSIIFQVLHFPAFDVFRPSFSDGANAPPPATRLMFAHVAEYKQSQLKRLWKVNHQQCNMQTVITRYGCWCAQSVSNSWFAAAFFLVDAPAAGVAVSIEIVKPLIRTLQLHHLPQRPTSGNNVFQPVCDVDGVLHSADLGFVLRVVLGPWWFRFRYGHEIRPKLPKSRRSTTRWEALDFATDTLSFLLPSVFDIQPEIVQ